MASSGNCEGDSEKQSFLTYGVTGATWKINGRNYVTGNAALLTRPTSGAPAPEPAHPRCDRRRPHRCGSSSPST
jgi:hypothetical protein